MPCLALSFRGLPLALISALELLDSLSGYTAPSSCDRPSPVAPPQWPRHSATLFSQEQQATNLEFWNTSIESTRTASMPPTLAEKSLPSSLRGVCLEQSIRVPVVLVACVAVMHQGPGDAACAVSCLLPTLQSIDSAPSACLLGRYVVNADPKITLRLHQHGQHAFKLQCRFATTVVRKYGWCASKLFILLHHDLYRSSSRL